jgi:hypothetical protein
MSAYCRDTTPNYHCDDCDTRADELCPHAHSGPNESPSSPRTSGSPTGSRSDSAIEGTGTQLASVLRPDSVAGHEHEWWITEPGYGWADVECETCGETKRLFVRK